MYMYSKISLNRQQNKLKLTYFGCTTEQTYILWIYKKKNLN